MSELRVDFHPPPLPLWQVSRGHFGVRPSRGERRRFMSLLPFLFTCVLQRLPAPNVFAVRSDLSRATPPEASILSRATTSAHSAGDGKTKTGGASPSRWREGGGGGETGGGKAARTYAVDAKWEPHAQAQYRINHISGLFLCWFASLPLC